MCVWQTGPTGYTLDSPLAWAARSRQRLGRIEPRADEIRGLRAGARRFLVGKTGLRALSFWTQDSANLDPQNLVPHCGVGQIAQIG